MEFQISQNNLKDTNYFDARSAYISLMQPLT